MVNMAYFEYSHEYILNLVIMIIVYDLRNVISRILNFTIIYSFREVSH